MGFIHPTEALPGDDRQQQNFGEPGLIRHILTKFVDSSNISHF